MIDGAIISRTEFDINRIVVSKRKRLLGDISSLAQSIKELGLLHPISILPDGTLVSGYHRLEACKSLGWQMMPVVIHDWEELHAELAEIDENIIRSELKQIEQSRQLQRRKEIYEALHPETKQGSKGGWHNTKTTKLETAALAVSSFSEDTAKKTGKAERTIRTNIQIARNISPDLDEAILATPLADNQHELIKLARMTPEQQKVVVETLRTTPARKTVSSTMNALRQEEQQKVDTETHVISEQCKILDACSIASLHVRMEAESLDAIITDPPYPRKYLPVYNDLADFAIHALKPGGSLIVMVGQSYLPDILNMLQKPPLKYHWLSCYYVPGDTAKIWRRRIGASWKPLLWFVKGEYTGPWKKDVIKGEDIFLGNGKDKKHHEWGQPVHDMVNIIEHFTQSGQMICDPFLGGGTTALASIMCERRFIGCDIDQQCVETTKKRVREGIERLSKQS